jgi:hypothetical protein
MQLITTVKRPMEIKDEEYVILQNIIDEKRKMLLKKQRQVVRLAKVNSFLRDLKDDYLKYNNYIVKQKQDQIVALQLLNNYIDDLKRSGQLSEYNIQDAKTEQRKILNELKSVRSGLDKILTDTNDVNNLLIAKNEANYYTDRKEK